MSLILTFLKNPKYLVLTVALIAASYVFYIAVDRVILQQEIKNVKATEAQNHERNKTNQTINRSSDADKCKLIGGVFANGSCI